MNQFCSVVLPGRRWVGDGAALLVASIAGALCIVSRASMTDLRQIREAGNKIEPLHQRKLPAGPNDWLAQHKEAGQTFDQYLKSKPNRPTATRTTLYVQPLGEFSERQTRLVEETAELLGLFYNLPVKTLDSLGLEVIPDEARRTHPAWGDRQILSTYVLDKVLKPRLPADAVAMLALTTSDLWPGDNWNFVFGQASLAERVGVWSLSSGGLHSGGCLFAHTLSCRLITRAA